MTVTEYRTHHPDCAYCKNKSFGSEFCSAINKKMSKRQAKRCPCYTPMGWMFDFITNKSMEGNK